MVLWQSTSVSIKARRDKIMIIQLAKEIEANKYFYVSRDKAADLFNMTSAGMWVVELLNMHDSLIQELPIKRP